ncbi:MAG: hypothetical protein HWE12_03305 [Oceanospirillaceae bacterium]|nr:hypothetical protein [Oceanospirillaceae bacterium]
MSQSAVIDHADPNFDNVALSNGKISLSATATVIDGDLDTATADYSLDMGGKISFDNYVAPITVTGGSYNEGSPRAIFTVSANDYQMLTLDVVDNADTGKAPTGDDEGGSDDSLDLADIFYSIDGGATWVKYNGTPFQAGTQDVLVAVDITNERDDVYEGEEQLELIVNSGVSTQASGFSSIFDDGTGGMTDPIDETTTNDPGTPAVGPSPSFDDDRPITVTGGDYNEGSPRAIFTVDANPNQYLTLDVVDNADTGKAPTGDDEGGSDDSLDLADIYYSVDGGANWVKYDGTPFQAGTQDVLVAVDITNERDDVYEGEEQLELIVNSGASTQASGFSSIFDDGTGGMADPIDENTTNNPGTPSVGPSPSFDDDRPLAVNDIEVNEGTGQAIFTISGAAGQYTKLELVAGTATTDDFGPGLEYWDGNTWKPYTPGSFVRLDSAGKLFVRTPIVNDDILEGGHSFELRATNTGGSSDLGSATIYDDGTSVKQVFTNGVLTTSTVGLDDDTPAPPPPPPPPAPAAFTAPEPPPAEEPVVEVPEPAPAPAADVVLEQPDNELIVMRNIPEQRFSAGDGFTTISYQIPTDTFGHTETETEITLSALMATGEDLPKWLIFDPEKGEFRGIPPEGFSGTLIIRVIARDANGDQVETMVTIEVISDAQTSVSVGKADLFAQLQSDSQFSWRAARDQLVQAAKRMRG